MAVARTKRVRAYLNIESLPVMWVTVVLLIGLVGVSFTMSFNALVAIASWTGLPEHLFWTVPLTIDSGILIFTLCALVMRARAQRGATAYAWSMLVLFTVMSIAANVMHAVDATTGAELRRVVTGAVLAGAAPFVVAAASHMLSLTVIEPADALVTQPRTAPGAQTSAQAKPRPVVAVAAPGAGMVAVAGVDEQIRSALTGGVVPTGREIGDWLGGKSPRTGQRHLAGLAQRDATVGRAIAELEGANTESSRTPSWAVTA